MMSRLKTQICYFFLRIKVAFHLEPQLVIVAGHDEKSLVESVSRVHHPNNFIQHNVFYPHQPS